MVEPVTLAHSPGDTGREIWNANDRELYERVYGLSGTPDLIPGPAMGSNPTEITITGTARVGTLGFRMTNTSVPNQRLFTIVFAEPANYPPVYVSLFPQNAQAADLWWNIVIRPSTFSVDGFEVWAGTDPTWATAGDNNWRPEFSYFVRY